jgi:hypothetical protein
VAFWKVPRSSSQSASARRSASAARAGNRRFGRLSALRAHTNAPSKNDVLWETPRALHRPRAGPDRVRTCPEGTC